MYIISVYIRMIPRTNISLVTICNDNSTNIYFESEDLFILNVYTHPSILVSAL